LRFPVKGKPVSLVKWLAHPSVSRSLLRVLSAASAGALLLSMSGGVAAKETHRTTDSAAPHSIAAVALTDLPPQAQQTHRLVLSGGPFPYAKDGVVFGNRERLLPAHSRGYYREYTVKTPGSRNRGARRLVCGGSPPTAPEVCYYTADHYNSFRRIVVPAAQ
jgi:ribonuclease T1